jgi:lytic murein transglycosylase
MYHPCALRTLIGKTFLSVVTLGMLLQTPLALAAPTKPSVAPCEKDGSFAPWLNNLKSEILQNGVSQATLDEASPFMTFDPSIVKKDHEQGIFQQSFLQFSDRMVSAGRIHKGTTLINGTYKDLFDRIEKQYGVPAAPIVAFWGLESDFGAITGNVSTLTAVTTLAYDCRRADLFREQILAALQLIDRGDLKPKEMIGSWAGELGGTQFMASDYLESGVDFDGDGHVDLIRSVPDTLASAAHFLVNHGWHRGEPWLQEVRVPAQMRWEEADITIQHPISQWASWGITAVNGSFESQTLPASLVLPMGRLGPAFLAYPNFQAILAWNSSTVYSTTVAYFATRLSGAAALRRGNGAVTPLTTSQLLELQNLLLKHGFNPGDIDGKLGNDTRMAVKQAQLKFGLPADSYPTLELLALLRKS